jgi:hypothetical protein
MKKYFILTADKFETIDWTKTYESMLTVKWRTDLTEFIISCDKDTDYLNDVANYDSYYIRGIFASDEWGNIELPLQDRTW